MRTGDSKENTLKKYSAAPLPKRSLLFLEMQYVYTTS